MKGKASLRVSFQGECGAFSHSAALKLLGSHIEVVPHGSFTEVFSALNSETVDFAVVPIENTLHGSVHENYDHLLEYDLPICGETSLRISHQLIAQPGVRFSQIRKVYSHPVALNQCRKFFAKHKLLQAMPYYDTAGSVKALKELGSNGIAAIASEMAAALYDGVILRRDIEDNRQNYTRFFLLSKQNLPARSGSGDLKTSLVFTTSNTPGALFRAMSCLALRDLSLTKIESRPIHGKPWEYLFYVDFLGGMDQNSPQRAVDNLREYAQSVKLLGSYRTTP